MQPRARLPNAIGPLVQVADRIRESHFRPESTGLGFNIPQASNRPYYLVDRTALNAQGPKNFVLKHARFHRKAPVKVSEHSAGGKRVESRPAENESGQPFQRKDRQDWLAVVVRGLLCQAPLVH